MVLFGLFAIPQAFHMRVANSSSETVSTASWVLMVFYSVIRIVNTIDLLVDNPSVIDTYVNLVMTAFAFFSSLFILWSKYQTRNSISTQLAADLI